MPTAQDRYPALTSPLRDAPRRIQLAAPLLQLPVLPPGHPVKLPQQPFQLSALYAVAPLAELLQRRAAAAAMALYQKHRPLLQLIKLPDKLLRRQIRQLAAKHHGIITDTLPQLCQQLFAAAKQVQSMAVPCSCK